MTEAVYRLSRAFHELCARISVSSKSLRPIRPPEGQQRVTSRSVDVCDRSTQAGDVNHVDVF